MPMLPFRQRGAIHSRDGDLIAANVPVAVWPASGQASSASGETWDHVGEMSAHNADLVVDVPNLWLDVDGRRYTIVSATLHDLIVPHVALTLRRAAGAG